MESVDCGVWGQESKVQIVECGIWSVKCGVRSVESKV